MEFSASDLCSDGRVIRMWVRIPTATMVLMSLSKTLYHNLLLSTQELMGTCEDRVGCCVWLALCAEMAAIELYTPRELRWFQEWFMRLMSRDNNAPWAPKFGGYMYVGYISQNYYYYYLQSLPPCHPTTSSNAEVWSNIYTKTKEFNSVWVSQDRIYLVN